MRFLANEEAGRRGKVRVKLGGQSATLCQALWDERHTARQQQPGAGPENP